MASKDDLAVAIGRTVRSAVERSGMTLADTAERIGVSERSMSRRVNGTISFTFPELYRLAEEVGADFVTMFEDAEREVARIEAARDPQPVCDTDTSESAA